MITQVTSLAGPGPVAGGVVRVFDTQRAILREAGLRTNAVAGWLGPTPTPEGALHLVRLRRITPHVGLRGLIGLAAPTVLGRAARNSSLFHVHLCRDFFTTTAVRRAAAHSVPVVAQSHGMLQPPRTRTQEVFDARVLGPVLPLVSLWLTLTAAEESALARLGVPRELFRRVPNAVEPATELWSATSDGPVTFVSRLHARKRPEVFVEAALELLRRGSGATFVIAGPDAGSGELLRRMVMQAGHASSFTFTGPLDSRAARALIARSRAVVLPSVDEPYPMVALEAAAAGTPLIISVDTGVSELLALRRAALVVAPDCIPVAEAILRVLTDGELSASLSREALQTYASNWSPPVLRNRLLEVYGEVGVAA